jgi:acyl carrier protein
VVSTLDLDQQLAQVGSSSLAERVLPGPPKKQSLHARPALQTAYVPPSGELEQGLVELWSEFLGISSIGIEDNLFELGGDSLLAMQLLAKIRLAYGVEIHPTVFFRSPTIAASALLVEERLIEEIENTSADADTAPCSSAII